MIPNLAQWPFFKEGGMEESPLDCSTAHEADLTAGGDKRLEASSLCIVMSGAVLGILLLSP